MIDIKPKLTEEGEKRRHSLIQAVLKVIVERGFEGLRTRAVADLAGANVATLHYYFPTKEAMIAEFMDYVARMFSSTHGPAPEPCGSPALDRLHQEFSDAKFYMEECGDFIIAIQELTLRSRHDPFIRSRLQTMDFYWRLGLLDLIAAGIEEGVFRPELDPAITAETLMAVLSGAGVKRMEHLEGICSAIEGWILAPNQKRKDTNE